jgi:hypothetical protein
LVLVDASFKSELKYKAHSNVLILQNTVVLFWNNGTTQFSIEGTVVTKKKIMLVGVLAGKE